MQTPITLTVISRDNVCEYQCNYNLTDPRPTIDHLLWTRFPDLLMVSIEANSLKVTVPKDSQIDWRSALELIKETLIRFYNLNPATVSVTSR